MGKSRLLAEAGHLARRCGAEVVDGLGAPVSRLRTPALVLLDDAQRLPDGAASAIGALRAQLADRAVVWVLSRTPGADVAQTDIGLCGAAAVQERLLVGPLSERASQLLASDAAGCGHQALTARQVEEAGGHPATLMALAARSRDPAVSDSTGPAGYSSEVKHLVDRLLQTCSPACRRTVRIAAVFGRDISFDSLSRVAELSPVALLKDFDEATAAGLIRCEGAGYAFSSELFWRVVRSTVPAQVQEVMLRQTAAWASVPRPQTSVRDPAVVVAPSADGASGPQPDWAAGQDTGTVAGDVPGREKWPALTEQQQTIASLAADGLTNRQIGERIFLSPHTVNYHLRKVYGTLRVASRIELSKVVHLTLAGAEADS
ncbi:LuxR C-terminal-related transcriptional regulator [Streptomyces sp. NBC_00683]|uniref:helix-turn-helix domain-containing protein n=1 Tax=Streptomyces sp. NBC_00683 TaxID=2903670 RepID=UPI002E2EAE04|nr:LuxR C-terminal-related transcriptional regulator [Streptomyces sp. NBC_00683]